MARTGFYISRKQLLESNVRLTNALISVSTQCGNVIYNCEQAPADNRRHLDSWKGVKDFVDAALNGPVGSPPS